MPYVTPIQAAPCTSTVQSPARPHSHHHAGRSAAATASAVTAAKPDLYNPRHSEQTRLYQTIAEHFETWVESASAGWLDGQGHHHTPKPNVCQAVRKHLQRGISALGFNRAWCNDCGHDYFVACSCEGRGVCPSCNTRRMVETAAHICGQVFPRPPIRHCVLSGPKRLRYFTPPRRRVKDGPWLRPRPPLPSSPGRPPHGGKKFCSR